jgi:hypothetical protein
MKRVLLTEEAARKQRDDIVSICEVFDWDIRLDIASCFPVDHVKRKTWGGYSEKCYARRSRFTKFFVRTAIKGINRKLRDSKHYPLYFIHEYAPNDFEENLYSSHIHSLIKNDTGYSNDILYRTVKAAAGRARIISGLDCNVQLVDKDKGPSGYIGKFVEYDKMTDHNEAFRKLCKKENQALRSYKLKMREEAQIIVNETNRELNEKLLRRLPFLDLT